MICAWLVQIGAGLSVGNVSLNTRGRQAGRRPALLSQNTHVCRPKTAAMEPRGRRTSSHPVDTPADALHSNMCSERQRSVGDFFFCLFVAVAARA